MEGMILLSVVVALFVAAGVYILCMWGRPIFPVGHRVTAEYGSSTAHVVFYKNTRLASNAVEEEFARLCAMAVEAVATVGRRSDASRNHDVCVWVQTQIEYNKHLPLGTSKSAAYITNVGFKFGWKPYPLIVMGERYMTLVAQTGNPVIHEMMHAIAGASKQSVVGDIAHSDGALWEAVGGNTSLESVAKSYYKTLRARESH